MPTTNQEIAELFENLGTLLETKGDSIFKIRAYRHAARTIEQLPFELERAVMDGANMESIPGIGNAISSKIQELLTTGQVATYERLKGEIADGSEQ